MLIFLNTTGVVYSWCTNSLFGSIRCDRHSCYALFFYEPWMSIAVVHKLLDDVTEEHYISRLMFSWPQVSCVSNFPERGSRAGLILSAISSKYEFISWDGSSHKDNEGWICAVSDDSIPNHMPLTLAPEVSQDSHTEEMKLSHGVEEILSVFLPSFTSFLTNCPPEVEVDLKDQIVKYPEDSSFHDKLVKIEKVIHELGDNTVL
ncbi:unnamed protein product [Withania somnifera]